MYSRFWLPCFGLSPCLTLLQRPIHVTSFPVLDFFRAFRCSNIQFSLSTSPFWTSSVPSATLTSNLLLRLPDFGLLPCLPLLQRPILTSGFPVLDFLRAFHCSNVQSTSPTSRFWTSSVPSAALTSNSRFQLPGFGLLPCLPLLQRPILTSGFPVLDFFRAFRCSNVQFPSLASR